MTQTPDPEEPNELVFEEVEQDRELMRAIFEGHKKISGNFEECFQENIELKATLSQQAARIAELEAGRECS